jgi:hypothetical protein
VAIVWRHGVSIAALPRWSLVMAGGAGMAASVLVWRALAEQLPARSPLPGVVLGLGVLASGLLIIVLLLAQHSWRLARTAERRQVRRALETPTDGVWEWSVPSHGMLRSAMWRGLGYGLREPPATVRCWLSRVHPEDLPALETALRSHLAGESDSLAMEYRIQAADGSWHWIVDRARVVERTAFGTPTRVFGIYADITERRTAAEALRASERRFRVIFDSTFQFQILLGVDGALLEANRTVLEFGGVSLPEVYAAPLWHTRWWTGGPDRTRRLQEACAEAARGRTVQYQEEIQGSGEGTATVELSVKPIRGPAGDVVQLLVEGRDVTERIQAEAALRELDTLSTLGRLAARVAHEVNNPLAGIQNSFTLLKDAVPRQHRYYRYVGAIEREIARIAGVTRELYGLYRAEHSEKRESSVSVAIADAVALLNQLNRSSSVRIRTDTERAPQVLPHPDALIRQVIFNLIQNGVEASPQNGTVQVTAWSDERMFHLSVRDHGPGVPTQVREKIFADFYSTKSGLPTGGMGLGLAIVRRSLTALGGEILILDPPDGGADFRVRLPLRPPAAAASGRPTSAAAATA